MLDVRPLNPNVVNTEFRAAVNLKQAMRFFEARFHLGERRDLGVLRGFLGNNAYQTFSGGRAVSEADFRFEALIDVRRPLEPVGLLAAQLDQPNAPLSCDAAGALDTAFAINHRQFQNQRIAVTKII